jgi:ABC-type microcin C transport system permease subunit YejB
MKLTLLQKTGLVVFGIGVVFIFAVGWFYSWWMVPAIREHGFQNIPVPGIVSFIWGLSTPVGALIVLAGAGMYAQVPFHRILVLAPGIFVVVFLVAVLAPSTMRPVLFGIDGGLMSLLFVGILW